MKGRLATLLLVGAFAFLAREEPPVEGAPSSDVAFMDAQLARGADVVSAAPLALVAR